ncbi:MAG: pilus assembly protein, partial [Myxococcaceae bacterium]|nr:pilus assembly protein [Myxococcaceae bacterium]
MPLLITMTLFGMFFSELVRAKLKLLEASRFAVWEMTSYVLDDYGNAQHGAAFNEARGHTLSDSRTKFRDLDSVADRGNTGLIAGFSGFDARLENNRVELTGTFSTVQGRDMPLPPRTLGGTASEVHRLFGFNQTGRVQADVTVRLDNRILPRDFLNDDRSFFKADQWGGSNLQSILLRSRYTMIASGWHLADGADAIMQKDEG